MGLFDKFCKLFSIITCCIMATVVVLVIILIIFMPLIIFALTNNLWSLILYFIFAIMICNTVYRDGD